MQTLRESDFCEAMKPFLLVGDAAAWYVAKIPIDEASRVSEQLRVAGRVSRGRIGVQIDQVSKDVAESIGLGKQQGALVRGVETGLPAEKAGVEAGDIITKFDGKTIEKFADLPRLVGNTKPGTNSALTVFRRGGTKDLNLIIAEIEPEKPVAEAAGKEDKAKASSAGQSLGLVVSELTDAQKKELKIKGGVKVDVATEAAACASIREGDVIVVIANTEVGNVKEFEAAVAKMDRTKCVNVLFRRGEWAQYALIRAPRRSGISLAVAPRRFCIQRTAWTWVKRQRNC